MFYRETAFQETPNGKIPKDWNIRKIGDVSRIVTGGTPGTKHPEYFDGDVKWLKSGDIKGLYIYDTEEKITQLGIENSNAKIHPPNSVAIALSGRGQTRGRTAIIRVPMSCSQSVAFMIPTEQIVPEYLHYNLSSRYIEIRNLTGDLDRSGLNLSIVSKISFPFPHLNEQHKIVEVFSCVDLAIQKTKGVIAKTERLKKGLMQELLTRGIGHKEYKETEIGRIPKAWQVMKLEDALDLCQYGLSVPSTEGGRYPIIRMDELANGYVSSEIAKSVDLNDKTFRAFKLEKEDILFNRTNSYELVGRTGIFQLEGDYVFASYLIRLRTKRDMLDPLFLTLCLIFSHDRLRQLATRAVHQANINATNLQKIRVPRPPLEEQRRIASILQTMDMKLDLEKKERARLERIKRGLMDLLLTGKVRIKVD